MRRTLVAVVLSFIAAAALIAGVAVVGKLTRDRLQERHGQTIHLCDIDFNPPPDQDRDLFLAELQYECGLEDTLDLRDENLLRRLTQAFLQHPRVESLERIGIDSGKRVCLRVKYRVTVLAVEAGGRLRAIDQNGILLPPDVSTDGLPVLRDTPLPPLVESGNTWADEAMRAAARTARALQPHQQQLRIVAIVARDPNRIALRTSSGAEILWGHAPGEEPQGEATAAIKIDRLQRQCTPHGDLDRLTGSKELDLR